MDENTRENLNRLKSEAPKYKGLDMTDKDVHAFRVNNLLYGEVDSKVGAFERYICAAERQERKKVDIRTQDIGYSIPPSVFRGTRDIIAGTDADGGFLVDDNTVPMAFAEYLYTKSVVIPRSTQLMDMKGTLSIGQETDKFSVVWGSEVSTATESQPTFGEVNLSPKELKVTTPVSNFLLMQSDPSAENLTRMCMMAAFAEAFDNKILYGNGTTEPSGLNKLDRIDTTPFAGRVQYNGDASLYRDILTPVCETIGKANAADMLTWLLGWGFHSKACQTYALLENRELLFIPYEVSTSVADTDAWLGNWEYLVTAMWGGVDIVIDKTSLLHQSLCRVVGHYRVDSAALHEDAFALVTEA